MSLVAGEADAGLRLDVAVTAAAKLQEVVLSRTRAKNLIEAGCLTIDGTIVLVGALTAMDPPPNGASFIRGRKSLAGSAIGGMAETQEMIDFCAAHGIVSDVEMIEIQDVNTAYERLLKNDVHYRFVIDMASLKTAA